MRPGLPGVTSTRRSTARRPSSNRRWPTSGCVMFIALLLIAAVVGASSRTGGRSSIALVAIAISIAGGRARALPPRRKPQCSWSPVSSLPLAVIVDDADRRRRRDRAGACASGRNDEDPRAFGRRAPRRVHGGPCGLVITATVVVLLVLVPVLVLGGIVGAFLCPLCWRYRRHAASLVVGADRHAGARQRSWRSRRSERTEPRLIRTLAWHQRALSRASPRPAAASRRGRDRPGRARRVPPVRDIAAPPFQERDLLVEVDGRTGHLADRDEPHRRARRQRRAAGEIPGVGASAVTSAGPSCPIRS